MSNKYRTHNCNELNELNVNNKEVILSGWVFRKRDHGQVVFIDLRDHFGITQLVFDTKMFPKIANLRLESVITIKGKVVSRSVETINHSINTGKIEVTVDELNIISESEVLPLSVSGDQSFPEETRLRYRYLYLRTEKAKKNILLRSKVITELRRNMSELGFIEFQTPILTASSPEGARDYIVPSRVHQGKFYALPQAPQQFKQLLMVSGFDKYFQIAPCFRDEDARADRSPGEFYQLDIEMAFVTQEDVFSIVEPILYNIFTKFSNKHIDKNFPRITYAESMLRYGTDKPDLRNPLTITDMTEIFCDSEFNIFKKNIEAGMVVRAIPAPGTANNPRSFFDGKIEFSKEHHGASGLGYIIFDEHCVAKGPIAKFLDERRLNDIKRLANLQPGDSIFFASDYESQAAKISGEVRKLLGEELNLIQKDVFKFCWIVDFPYFIYDETEKKIDFFHNPFSMPQGGVEALNSQDLLKILAYQYDIVCNGIELSSGAIRNHSLDIMYKAFSIVGYSMEEVDKKFGALTNAFKFGVPPHGGIAPGIDRMIMLLADELNIREVICFPFNQKGEDLLMEAPSEVTIKHLNELGISFKKKK